MALNNAVVVITGGARGIGAATASLLAQRGATLAIADINESRATQTAATLGPKAKGYGLDVSDREAFDRVIESVEADLGPIDVLVNNAGIAVTSPRIAEQDPAMVERTLAVNLQGVINGTLSAVRKMSPRGRGQIVNIASLAGVMGVPGLTAYTAAKFGAVGFTEAIRAEYEGSGLTFTCVMPGPVRTDQMNGTSSSRAVKLVMPEQVARGVVHCISSRKDRLSIPRSSGALARITSILPPAAAIRLGRWTGMSRVYTEVDYDARAEYVDRVSSESGPV